MTNINISNIALRIPDYKLLTEYYERAGDLNNHALKYFDAIKNYEALRNVCRTTKEPLLGMDALIKIAKTFKS